MTNKKEVTTNEIMNFMQEQFAFLFEILATKEETQQIRTEVHELKSDVSQLKSDMHQLRSDMHQLRSDMQQTKLDLLDRIDIKFTDFKMDLGGKIFKLVDMLAYKKILTRQDTTFILSQK